MNEAKGKAKGGIARANLLSDSERKEIAAKAAKARWSLPVAEYAGELRFGDLAFPCAVLSDGTRVLTETDFMAGLGMYRSGALSVRREQALDGSAQVPLYLAFKNLEPFVSKHLSNVHITPLKYRTLSGGTAKGGIPATLIPKICSVWLDARKAGVLGQRQEQIAERAEILLRGLAEVGIIALVDEATGYERDRVAGSLAKILEAFIAKELQPWVKTFPSDFYEQLFRLRGLPYSSDSVKRPQYFGVLTNDIVYKRLAPGVLDELKKVTERDDDGRPKHKYFQKLTSNIGYPKLREHLGSVVTLMKLSSDYPKFKEKLDQIHPPYGRTMPLPLNYESETDDGHSL